MSTPSFIVTGNGRVVSSLFEDVHDQAAALSAMSILSAQCAPTRLAREIKADPLGSGTLVFEPSTPCVIIGYKLRILNEADDSVGFEGSIGFAGELNGPLPANPIPAALPATLGQALRVEANKTTFGVEGIFAQKRVNDNDVPNTSRFYPVTLKAGPAARGFSPVQVDYSDFEPGVRIRVDLITYGHEEWAAFRSRWLDPSTNTVADGATRVFRERGGQPSQDDGVRTSLNAMFPGLNL